MMRVGKGAALEGGVADGGDMLGQHYLLQTLALEESKVAYLLDVSIEVDSGEQSSRPDIGSTVPRQSAS